jgi:subtilisin family serine protease
MKMKSIFNNWPMSVYVGAAFLAFFTSRAGAETAPAIQFRDGTDWVQAQRLTDSGNSLTPISLQMRGRTGHASIDRRALVQLSATVAAKPAAFFRAQHLASVSTSLTNPRSTDALQSSAKPPTRTPTALNPRLHVFLVESTRRGEDGLALAARLSKIAGVESAIPDLYYEHRLADFKVPPNDPRYPGQRYLDRLQIERAWQVTAGDPDTTIVVIDDGCDMQHPDLVDAMLGGLDVSDNDDDPSFAPGVKGNEHGTACSGIIAAVGDNKLGIAGVCPRCTLRCVRLFDRDHPLVAVSTDLRAFNYAFESGAAVVSNSWGFAEPIAVPKLMRDAIEELLDHGRDGRGTSVVFAAGNENRVIDDAEIGAIPGVLNVGAVNFFDEAAPFSNLGNSLSLTAPTGTLTTDISGRDGSDPGDYTSLFGGTSSACPVVAGVAALILSAAPDKTAREISDLLVMTSRPAPFAIPDANGHDPIYGRGIVDPTGALTALGFDVPELPREVKDAGAEETDAAADGGKRNADDDNDDGCGCRVPGAGSAGGSTSAIFGVALAAFTLGRRTRARRRSFARRD